jgi:hypothetical protein
MTKQLTQGAAFKEMGVGGVNTRNKGSFLQDEFLPELRGRRAVRKYREMADNDPIIGAALHAMKQTLRNTTIDVVAVDESAAAVKEKEFVESVLKDMDHSIEDFIAEVLTFLEYGWSWFEVVYKRRDGMKTSTQKFRSLYTDGRIGVRKLAPRAQWTTEHFEITDQGDIMGMWQEGTIGKGRIFLTKAKSIHFRTTTVNNEPAGRSVLRNAYVPYTYLNALQRVEAIGIERELTGMPVGRMPAEYLSPNATNDQKALRASMEKILRDVRFNDQGYLLLPSDTYTDSEGKVSNVKMLDVELIASQGSRAIDTRPVVNGYQTDIARTVLAEFLMLGSGAQGSFALSKSKTDIFLLALEGYMGTIVASMNKQLLPVLWELNGLDFDLMPTLKAGDVAPHDLREISGFLRNLNQAGISVSDQPHIVDDLLRAAGLPKIKPEIREETERKAQEDAQTATEAQEGAGTPPTAPTPPTETEGATETAPGLPGQGEPDKKEPGA